MEDVGRRVGRRRQRRRVVRGVASGAVMAGFILIAVLVRTTASTTLPVTVGTGRGTVEVRLLDGTLVRLTLPRVLAEPLARMTQADVQLHGSVSAGPTRAWAIDVSRGSVNDIVSEGRHVALPRSSHASVAVVDGSGRRLAVQFGAWALVASGDSMTDVDIDTLLADVSLVERPDGYVEYRGTLALWAVDRPDVTIGDDRNQVAVILGDNCTGSAAGGFTEVCDHANRLRVNIRAARPLSVEEVADVRVQVLSVGSSLAAIQRGEHP